MSLTVENVSKQFKDKQALSHISVTFKPQTIYGLLGRNGAGKSTLLNIINNRSFPSEGQVELNNESVFDNEICLNNIYLMSEDNLFPSTMKITKMLTLSEQFYGSFDWKLANQMIEEFELNKKTKFRKLSTGYRSIIKLIIALCVPCDYIFLDEPVLGLDAGHRELFSSFLVVAYEKRPRTFVISTHLIEEIANMLEHVVIMNKGKIEEDCSVEELLSQTHLLTGSIESIESIAPDVHVIGKETLGGLVTLYTKGNLSETLPKNIAVSPVSLQDYFIQLTKRK